MFWYNVNIWFLYTICCAVFFSEKIHRDDYTLPTAAACYPTLTSLSCTPAKEKNLGGKKKQLGWRPR